MFHDTQPLVVARRYINSFRARLERTNQIGGQTRGQQAGDFQIGLNLTPSCLLNDARASHRGQATLWWANNKQTGPLIHPQTSKGSGKGWMCRSNDVAKCIKVVLKAQERDDFTKAVQNCYRLGHQFELGPVYRDVPFHIVKSVDMALNDAQQASLSSITGLPNGFELGNCANSSAAY